MTERIVPEPFPPGDAIKEELIAREWKQIDLAQIMGVSNKTVHDLVSGKKKINAKAAQALADVFGSLPEEWMKLQSMYDLAVELVSSDDSRTRKSRLWQKAPIRAMINRGWLEETESIDFLEAQVEQFYHGEFPEFSCAARKSTDYEKASNEQLAWFRRAKNLAESLAIPSRYDRNTFKELRDELAPLRIDPHEVINVPNILINHGIRFLIVEPFPGSKIDGVAFWLDTNQPVIALSMRYDRIDWFWFTLAHELAHVYYGHGKERTYLDTSLVGAHAQPFQDKKVEERKADQYASSYLIDEEKLAQFVEIISPLYSNKAIRGFAQLMRIHPGIVVGRLQHMNKIAYNRGHDMLVKVRDIIVESAITDGWDNTISI